MVDRGGHTGRSGSRTRRTGSGTGRSGGGRRRTGGGRVRSGGGARRTGGGHRRTDGDWVRRNRGKGDGDRSQAGRFNAASVVGLIFGNICYPLLVWNTSRREKMKVAIPVVLSTEE